MNSLKAKSQSGPISFVSISVLWMFLFSISFGVLFGAPAPVQAAGEHDYFNRLITLPQHTKSLSLRDQAQLNTLAGPPATAFSYNPAADTYPNRQDAAKYYRVGGSRGSVPLSQQLRIPVSVSSGSLIFTWDMYWGPEFRYNRGGMNFLKSFQVMNGTGWWTIMNELRPASKTDTREVGRHSDAFRMPGTGAEGIFQRKPLGNSGPGTPNQTRDETAYPIYHSVWNRYWVEIQLLQPPSAFNEWADAYNGGKQIKTNPNEPQGRYHMVSIYMADENRDAQRLIYKAPIDFTDGGLQSPKIDMFRFEFNTSQEEPTSGEMIGYARNFVMLQNYALPAVPETDKSLFTKPTRSSLSALSKPADTTNPTVTFLSPAANATVSKITTITAKAFDDVSFKDIQFKYNNIDIGGLDTTYPYTASWNTTIIPNGTYNITAVARDASNNTTTSAPLGVTVNNTGVVIPPPPPPVVVPPPSTVTCSTTIPTNAFNACYFNNQDFTSPVLSRTDTSINFDWGTGSPSSAVGVDSFSTRWEGDYTFQSGDHSFTITNDDGMRLYVDNQLVVESWVNGAARTTTANKALTAGTHRVKIEYYENTSTAVAKASWVKVGTPVNPPPPSPSNQLPQGAFDEVNTSGLARGWSYDPDSLSATNSIHLYLDGPAGAGKTPLAIVTTNKLRTDINTLKSISGNHGFEYIIPSSLKDGKTHTLYAYAIDISDSNKSTLLTGSPKSFNFAAPVNPPPPPVVNPPPPSTGGGGGSIRPTPPPSVKPTPTPVPTATRHARGALVNHNGTIYFLGADIKYPFPSAAVFLSWGSRFEDVVPANSGDIAMPTGPVVEFKITAGVTRHPRATLVNQNGTIYFLGADIRYPFPSAEVFLSWGSRFEDVVPANSGDILMPIGPIVELKR